MIQNNNNTPYRKESLEPYYAKLFIKLLNERYGFDYEYANCQEQSNSADALAISKAGKPTLKLQLCLAEGGIFKTNAINEKNWSKNKKFKLFEYHPNNSWKQWITTAIQPKITKNYSDVPELILIIQGYSPAPKKEQIEQYFHNKYHKTPFKGIYYVVPEQTIYPNGYVAVIRTLFDNQPIQFKNYSLTHNSNQNHYNAAI